MINTLTTTLAATFPERQVGKVSDRILLGEFEVSCNLVGAIVLSKSGRKVTVGHISEPIVFLTANIRKNVNFWK